MNTVTATGFLVKEAWQTTQPVTQRQILCFDLMLEDGRGDVVPWRCEIADVDVAKRAEPKLVPGSAVIVRGELSGRPFKKREVVEGFSRFIAVDRVEFSRVPAKAAEGVAA